MSSDHPYAVASAQTPSAASNSAGRIRIGRDPRNEVVLTDLQISRFHAEVRRVGDTFQVVDLGSRNGT